MAEKTEISWTDATFNPWWGCAKVSPACDHCYAERDSKRFAAGKVLWGVDAERREFGDQHWDEPLKWNRRPFFECSACGARGGDKAVGYERVCKACASPAIKPARMRIFCASMADVFDKNAPDGARTRLFKLIATTPQLDWLLLTKRIGNASRMLNDAALEYTSGLTDWDSAPLPNVWLGSTVVNQEEADRDILKLLALPARVRFLSIEPMLGPVDLRQSMLVAAGDELSTSFPSDARIDWVIAGGESGPHARAGDVEWYRSLMVQCSAAGVPFHLKQITVEGKKLPMDQWPADVRVQEFPQ